MPRRSPREGLPGHPAPDPPPLKQLHLPKKAAEASALADDLRNFQIQIAEDTNQHYDAFPVGPSDELVTALEPAAQPEPLGLQVF